MIQAGDFLNKVWASALNFFWNIDEQDANRNTAGDKNIEDLLTKVCDRWPNLVSLWINPLQCCGDFGQLERGANSFFTWTQGADCRSVMHDSWIQSKVITPELKWWKAEIKSADWIIIGRLMENFFIHSAKNCTEHITKITLLTSYSTIQLLPGQDHEKQQLCLTHGH